MLLSFAEFDSIHAAFPSDALKLAKQLKSSVSAIPPPRQGDDEFKYSLSCCKRPRQGIAAAGMIADCSKSPSQRHVFDVVVMRFNDWMLVKAQDRAPGNAIKIEAVAMMN